MIPQEAKEAKLKSNKWMEDEANVFACLLLMPKEMIEEDLKQPMDLGSDDYMKELAKKYQVPLTALMFRMRLLKQFKI